MNENYSSYSTFYAESEYAFRLSLIWTHAGLFNCERIFTFHARCYAADPQNEWKLQLLLNFLRWIVICIQNKPNMNTQVYLSVGEDDQLLF